MRQKISLNQVALLLAVVALVAFFAPATLLAQGRGGGPPRTGRSAAPTDLTGYWVSQIVDEWRFRVVPQKGDVPYMPINAEARKVANAWDPAKDAAEGNQCKAYGAVGVMQRPGRIHITWADDNTLKMEFDAGTQTRMIHFGNAPVQSGEPTWQGNSQGTWDLPIVGRGPAAAPMKGANTLKIVTTNMKPGYIRKNGVPYSDKAVLTEYVNRLEGAQGEQYLVVTAFVEDPVYLNGPFIRTYTFKKEADGSKWEPTPCWNR
jgi:hypothetical protein